MSTIPKFKSSKEAKDAGWFSRRHQTSKENTEAHEKMIQKKNKKHERN